MAEPSDTAHPHPADAAKDPAANGPGPAPPGADLPFCPQFLHRTRDAIILQDIEGHLEWMNPAAEAMFNVSLDAVRGIKVMGHVLPDGARVDPAKIAAFRYDIGSSLFDRTHLARHKRVGGQVFWNLHSFTLLATPTGPKVAVTCRDVTETVEAEQTLRHAKARLQHAAHHDDLTGLANRKRLTQYLASDILRRALAERRVGVLHLDLDKFKEINDTLGHAAGDAALRHVADLLRRFCGPQDLACRIGGDEFLLVCLGTATEDALLTRAELLLGATHDPLMWNNQAIRVGLSIGACLTQDSTERGEALIHHADQALYEAKTRGRGRVMLYTPALGQVQIAQNRMTRELRLAAAEKQLTVHLQPQLDLARGRVTGCETLLRWNHPRLGQLPPGAFFETARRAGVLADLDYHSMHLSLDALTRLHAAGFDDLTIALNVSAEALTDVNYPGLLDWALQSRGLNPSQICVEITETTILQGGGRTIAAAVDRLKRMGARVALDDFGTGYAGLAHISEIEVDEIKLDCSLTANLATDPRNRAIVRSIIELCRKLGTHVTAEGVETAEQLRLLRVARCPAIQGFVLAHPQPCDDMIAWLSANLPLPTDFGRDPPEPRVTRLHPGD
ncbi:Cyclic di-GMP phosphodiesterase Gmr [Roseovarius sp. THAF8]|uniref:putative bifunctional diguanylate cyclase/phosphodiesterase n=1 Tax=Roseovarius sp. THAF8 TaxID=2587846 RepID=UPI0012A8DF91|nr:GGDEF domain-containing phosphodiesterase [Roseovarius sp. THAF8]QFT98915.1 Cyclic di-GMP phosphodiesterase Gmr [Roseovarius sp. THAF8]